MNKLFMGVFLLLIIGNEAKAQPSLNYGVKIQTEFNTLKIQDLSDDLRPAGTAENGQTAIGYSIGGVIELKLSELFFIRSGIDYEQSNYLKRITGFVFGTGPALTDERIRINSIGVPLSVGLKFGGNEEMNFVLGLGVYGNIPVKSFIRTEIDHETIPDETLKERELVNAIPKLGFIFHTGVEYRVGDKLILGIEPHVKLLKNRFELTPFDSEGESLTEFGVTIYLKV